jgi:hypothetical protein
MANDSVVQIRYVRAENLADSNTVDLVAQTRISRAFHRLPLNPDTTSVTYVFDYVRKFSERPSDTLVLNYRQQIIANEPSCDAHIQYVVTEIVNSTFERAVINEPNVVRRNEDEFLINLYVYVDFENFE